MNRSNRISYAIVLLVCCGATTGSSDSLLGSVHSGTYGETTYEEIHDIEVSARRVFSNHTYEIVIPGTVRGNPMIYCQLYDGIGGVLARTIENSASRETKVHFSLAREAASARCFYARGERLTRPSGPTPQP